VTVADPDAIGADLVAVAVGPRATELGAPGLESASADERGQRDTPIINVS